MHVGRAPRFVPPAGIVDDVSFWGLSAWSSDLETEEDVVMSIHFCCPHCRLSLTSSDDREGSVVDCPRCQGAMRIELTAARVALSAAKSKPIQEVNDPFSFIEPEPILDKKPMRGRSGRAVAALSVGVVGLMLAVYGAPAASRLGLWHRASKVGVHFLTDPAIPTAVIHDDGPFASFRHLLAISCSAKQFALFSSHHEITRSGRCKAGGLQRSLRTSSQPAAHWRRHTRPDRRIPKEIGVFSL